MGCTRLHQCSHAFAQTVTNMASASTGRSPRNPRLEIVRNRLLRLPTAVRGEAAVRKVRETPVT